MGATHTSTFPGSDAKVAEQHSHQLSELENHCSIRQDPSARIKDSDRLGESPFWQKIRRTPYRKVDKE